MMLMMMMILLRSSVSTPEVLCLQIHRLITGHLASSVAFRDLPFSKSLILTCRNLSGMHASLPARDGGLRIRPVSSLALLLRPLLQTTVSLQSDILSDCAPADNSCLHSYFCLGRLGRLSLAISQRYCRLNSPLGIAEICVDLQDRTRSYAKIFSQHREDWLFSLPCNSSYDLQLDS